MRPSPILILIGALVLALAVCAPVCAAPITAPSTAPTTAPAATSTAAPIDFIEYHGGLYTSYEFTDNYFGTAHDKESESIYNVGPTGQVIYTYGESKLDLSGHFAKSYHQNYSEDDGNDILFNSLYTFATQRTSLNLGYGYILTNQSAVESGVTGNSRTQTANAGLSHALTSSTTVGLNYTYYQQNNTPPDEDLVSHGVSGTIVQQLTQRLLLRITNSYDYHRYEIQSNAWVERSAVSLERQMSQRLTLSIDGEYQHEDQEDDDVPDADITSVYLTSRYGLTSATMLTLSGGYNWLDMKGMDREQTWAMRGELAYRTENDVFTLLGSREYRAEFTTDHYGVYDSRSVYATWEKSLLRDLTLTSNITFDELKPVSNVDTATTDGDEKDFSGLVSLSWNPVKYLFITPSYAHYERIFEFSDTERENRYKLVVEVKY